MSINRRMFHPSAPCPRSSIRYLLRRLAPNRTLAVLGSPFGLALWGLSVLLPSVSAQPGVNREQMWPAPSAEDWKKPCLITWQRTWDDAVAVSRETGRAILVCVNMDGEIASEHYAGIRYRQPEIAALYEPYITVIASVYRHTPRDFDESGRRIPCPRFGGVTCGEHIAIEPILYEKYFDGQRVAPRHVMVELDGEEAYDVYYAFDTDSVFAAIRDGIAERENQPPTVVRGDRPLIERVASRDSRDRAAVENAYREGDRELRQSLLKAAVKHADVASVDLLRLAVFGFDTDMSKLARQALAKTKSEAAIELIPEALRVPMESEEREALLGALKRLGDSSSSPWTRWISSVHQGLATGSSSVNVDGWSEALAGAEYPAPPSDWVSLESELASKSTEIEEKPLDGKAQLELGEASLAFALEASQAFGTEPTTEQLLTTDPSTARRLSRSKYYEARRAAREAEKLGETSWRVHAVQALADYYLGEDLDAAYEKARIAVEKIPSGATEWNAMAVLTIFAEGRFKAIKQAVNDKKPWPPGWLTDVHSAYSVLLRHPLGTDSQVVWHHDFLQWLGAKERASRYLHQGLDRFPDSPALHQRLRGRILAQRGARGLEPAYEALLRRSEASANLSWFAGLASFVAAQFHRRAGNDSEALAAYERSIDHYEEAIERDPTSRETSEPYIALAMAGRARLAFEEGSYERAVDELLASFQRKPEAAATLDGLNISPVDTAKMLRARLLELERTELVARLQSALDELDPSLLELPLYERQTRRNRR